jgi:hypothetical protein
MNESSFVSRRVDFNAAVVHRLLEVRRDLPQMEYVIVVEGDMQQRRCREPG